VAGCALATAADNVIGIGWAIPAEEAKDRQPRQDLRGGVHSVAVLR